MTEGRNRVWHRADRRFQRRYDRWQDLEGRFNRALIRGIAVLVAIGIVSTMWHSCH